jgi:hypothetical protein
MSRDQHRRRLLLSDTCRQCALGAVLHEHGAETLAFHYLIVFSSQEIVLVEPHSIIGATVCAERQARKGLQLVQFDYLKFSSPGCLIFHRLQLPSPIP